jgi:hypothetical protein
MGGRIYDPKLARFLTPDPLLTRPLHSQSYNPYSYAMNSPFRFVDPTGFGSEDSGAPIIIDISQSYQIPETPIASSGPGEAEAAPDSSPGPAGGSADVCSVNDTVVEASIPGGTIDGSIGSGATSSSTTSSTGTSRGTRTLDINGFNLLNQAQYTTGGGALFGKMPAVAAAAMVVGPLLIEAGEAGVGATATWAAAHPGTMAAGTALAAGASGQVVSGFNAAESAIIQEAGGILGAAEFGALRAAHEAGQSMMVRIGGRVVQYEPGLPASGMTMFGDNGFLIGREAFASSAELAKTVLHELYRLENSSAAAVGVCSELAAKETAAAFGFAERAIGALSQ